MAFEVFQCFRFMKDQINVIVYGEIIYKSDEIVSTMSFSHIHWAINVRMLSCKGKVTLLAFPNGNLVAFSTKHYSQMGKSIFSIDPKRPALAYLFSRSCPMCHNVACHLTS